MATFSKLDLLMMGDRNVLNRLGSLERDTKTLATGYSESKGNNEEIDPSQGSVLSSTEEGASAGTTRGDNSGAVVARPNLFQNSGFESFDKNATVPALWSATGTTFIAAPQEAITGTHTVQLTNGASLSQQAPEGVDVPGSGIVVSVFARVPFGGLSGQTITINITHTPGYEAGEYTRYASGGGYEATNEVPNDGKWYRFSRSFTLVGGGRLTVALAQGGVASTIDIDAAKLEIVNANGGTPGFITPTVYEDIDWGPAQHIRNLSADNIVAGSLTVGGSLSTNPKITVLDGSNVEIISIGDPVGGYYGIEIKGAAGLKVSGSGSISVGNGNVILDTLGINIETGQNNDNMIKFRSTPNGGYLMHYTQAYEGPNQSMIFVNNLRTPSLGNSVLLQQYAHKTPSAGGSNTAWKMWVQDTVDAVVYQEKMEYWRTGGLWTTQGAYFGDGTVLDFAEKGQVMAHHSFRTYNSSVAPGAGGLAIDGNADIDGAAHVGGQLTVAGNSDLTGNLDITGAGGSRVFFKITDSAASADTLVHLHGVGISSGSNFLYADADGVTQFQVKGDGTFYTKGSAGIGSGAVARTKLIVYDNTNYYGLRVGGSTLGGAIVQGPLTATTSFARAWFGHNAAWDESDDLWHVDNIGNNDAAGILVINGGQLEFIIHPGTGATARTFTHANFVAGTKMTLSTAGNLTVAANITGTGGITALGTSAGLVFADRSTAAQWSWYASGGIARLYVNGADRYTFANTGDFASDASVIAGTYVSAANGLLKTAGAGSGVELTERDGAGVWTLYTNSGVLYAVEAGNVNFSVVNSGNGYFRGSLQVASHIYTNSGYVYGYNNQEMLRGISGDEWFRLNGSSHFANGTYTPGLLRADGGLVSGGVAGNGGGTLTVTSCANFGGATFNGSIGIAVMSPVDDTSARFGIVHKMRDGTTNNFYTQANGAGYLRAAAWTYGSDIRLKENIRPMERKLPALLALNPVMFDYIEGEKDQLGFIAQEVQPVLPELVSVVDETGTLGLKTTNLIPMLVQALQELVETYNTDMADLRAQIAALTPAA